MICEIASESLSIKGSIMADHKFDHKNTSILQRKPILGHLFRSFLTTNLTTKKTDILAVF